MFLIFFLIFIKNNSQRASGIVAMLLPLLASYVCHARTVMPTILAACFWVKPARNLTSLIISWDGRVILSPLYSLGIRFAKMRTIHTLC